MRGVSPGPIRNEVPAWIERARRGDGYYDSAERPDRRDHGKRMYPFPERACPPVSWLTRPRKRRDDGSLNPAYERDMRACVEARLAQHIIDDAEQAYDPEYDRQMELALGGDDEG